MQSVVSHRTSCWTVSTKVESVCSSSDDDEYVSQLALLIETFHWHTEHCRTWHTQITKSNHPKPTTVVTKEARTSVI